MATPVKDGKVWRHRFMLDGNRVSGTFSTKAEALAWEAEQRATIKQPTGSRKTCSDAFRNYEKNVSPGKRGARWEILRLAKFAESSLGPLRMGEVTTANIAAWRDARLKEVSPATVNRELNLLSNVFTVARRDWGWITANPVSDVIRPKDPPARFRRITEEEITRMCLALGFDKVVVTKTQRVAVAFLFAIETAMRAGEICNLRPGDIKGRVAHLRMTKNGYDRDVPLSKRALELLRLLPPSDALFDLTAPTLDALFRKARDRAGVEDLHFHDTRHEAITRLAKKMHVLDLARMTGHRDLNQLMIYYNAAAEDLAESLG